ncbi:hypothetical protein CY652_04090 [Burkholderia sp. WAC0059]|uniref:glycosyltransferase n=1 Tax=Burkholderia sp. WAC0059 TaxID=2066022 RepID=UPI000C7F406E|nr:glycosyltransferase [Burkholderia sp. WAC0059]PLZ03579.1 hypothetical protein CY652_04090 [Burkholderia sp. WAC0059]
MKPVSVAMATCNGTLYLPEQLESLARQVRLPAELVVTDDASTDDTPRLLEDFSRAAPFPVRIYRNAQRLGYRANFLKAARLCRSPYLAFCDQDDVWAPHKLQRSMSEFERRDVRLVYHNAVVTDSHLLPIDTLARDAAPLAHNGPLSLAPLKYGLGCTLLVDRALVRFSSFWERSLDFNDGTSPEGHDQWFFFLAGALGTIAYIREPLAHYRRHAATASLTTWAGASPFSRLRPFLLHSEPTWLNYAAACERRADILDEIALGASPGEALRALDGAEKYRAFARLYRERIALYRAATLAERWALFARLVEAGGYGRDVWAKGRKSALKDFCCAVLRLERTVPPLQAAGEAARLP